MDPKLQNFLEATGWSKEDLIRKLSAGENAMSATFNDRNYVTSTTSNKVKSTLQKNVPQFNHKTSTKIGSVENVHMNLFSNISLPPSYAVGPLPPPPIPPIPPPESFLSDDLLLQLNTSRSYLPPIYSRDSPSPTDGIGQSGVIDLLSDTESLHPEENIADTPREKVIDISDDEESAKKSSTGASTIKDSSSLMVTIDNNNARGSEGGRKNPFGWEKIIATRLMKDVQDPRREHGGSDRDSSSSRDKSRHCDKRKEKHKRRHTNPPREDRPVIYRSRSRSRSGSDRDSSNSRDKSRYCDKRKEKHKRRHMSSSSNPPREDRYFENVVYRSRSRSRSRSSSRRSSSHSKSRRSRDESGSSSRTSRKRTRSGSNERDIDWYSKTSRSERSTQPTEELPNSYYWQKLATPCFHHTTIPPTKSLKDAIIRLKNGTVKKRISLPDNFNECNNLSENIVPPTNVYIPFRNIVAEEFQTNTVEVRPKQKPQTLEVRPKQKPQKVDLNQTNTLEVLPKQKPQKIELKRRDVTNLYEDDIQKLMNKSGNDQAASDTTEKVSSPKSFIENKNKHLASEVSQLISNKKQSNTPESAEKSAELQSTDSIVIELDDNDDSEPVQDANRPNIDLQSASLNEFSNQSPSRNCLNVTESTSLNILAEESRGSKELNSQTLENVGAAEAKNNNASSSTIPISKYLSDGSLDEEVDQVETVAVEPSKDANVKVPKSQHLVVKHLSDISDYKSGDFSDDTDMDTKQCSENNNKSSDDTIAADADISDYQSSAQIEDTGSSENIPKTNHNEIGEKLKVNLRYIANEDLSDISDYEAAEEKDSNKDKNSIPDSQSSSEHCTEPLVVALADLPKNLAEKGVSSSESENISNIVSSETDDVVDPNEELTKKDPDVISKRRISQSSILVDFDDLEISLTKVAGDLSKDGDDADVSTKSQSPSEPLMVNEEDTIINAGENISKDDDDEQTSKNSQLISSKELEDKIELSSMKTIRNLSREESEVLVAEDVLKSSDEISNNTDAELMEPVEDVPKDNTDAIVSIESQILPDCPNDNEGEDINMSKDEDNDSEKLQPVSLDHTKVELEDKIEISSLKASRNLSREESEALVAEDASNSAKYSSDEVANDLMGPVEDLPKDNYNEDGQILPDCPNTLLVDKEETDMNKEIVTTKKSEPISEDHSKVTVELDDQIEISSMKTIRNLSKEESEALDAEDMSNNELENNTEAEVMLEDLSEAANNIIESTSPSEPSIAADISKSEEDHHETVDKPETQTEDILKSPSIELRNDLEAGLMENNNDLPKEDFVSTSKFTSEVNTQSALIKPIEASSKTEHNEDGESSKPQSAIDKNNSKISACQFEDISDSSDTEDTSPMKPAEIVFVDAQDADIFSPESTRRTTVDSIPDPLIDEDEDVEMKSLEDESQNTSESHSLPKICGKQLDEVDLTNSPDSTECCTEDSINDPLRDENVEIKSWDKEPRIWPNASESQSSKINVPKICDKQLDEVDLTNSPNSTECCTEDSINDPLRDEDVEIKSWDKEPRIWPNPSESQSSTTDVPIISDKEHIEVDLTNSDTDDDLEASILNAVELIVDDDGSIGEMLDDVIEDCVSDDISEHEQCLLDDKDQNMMTGSTDDLSKTCQDDELKSSESEAVDNLPKIDDLAKVVQVEIESDKTESTKTVMESLPTAVEMETDAITELNIPEAKEDETIPLDIETILRKCKENQDKALKDQAEQKSLGNVSPSAVPRAPKNRRPNFSSLRDTSMSTIQINLLLEQLSYKKSAENTTTGSEEISSDKNIKMAGHSKASNVERELFDFGKPFYDANVKDDIRNEILKQLDNLKVPRNDTAFSTSTNPTIIPKAKKTFTKLRHAYNDQDDEEEISIVNDNLESPVIWLTKTNDYTKIKGWKNKPIGVKTKKSSRPIMKTAEEDLAVPSCSFHQPSVVDNIIENVVADNTDDVDSESTVSAYSTSSISAEVVEVIDSSQASKEIEVVETNPFSSSVLDSFLLDKSEMELKISYEVPELLMGPRIKEPQKIHDNLLKGEIKTNVESPAKKDLSIIEGIKPRTLAEKRKLLNLDEPRIVSPKPTTYNTNQSVNKPVDVSRNILRNPPRRSINEDLPNLGHNKRKDFATASVYWKGKKYLVPCRERKAIYFRTKVFSRYETTSPSITVSPISIEPSKAVLWSPEKIVQKLLPIKNPKPDILCKAGPMSKKPQLIEDHSWTCVIKPLPKIFLEITAEHGKSLHPRALQFLYAKPYVDLSQDKVDFALTALRDSKPTKYVVPVSYENGQTHFTLRQKEILLECESPKTPPACGDIPSEVKDVVDDLLSCLDIQEIQETFIKDDPDFDPNEKPKPVISSKKEIKESAATTRVAAINKRLRIALGRLQVKFIDINIDEDPNKECDKAYCQLGCVCSSLLGALASKEHCRRIECVFGCICGYKPPVNTTVTLPAGSDMDLFSTVDKLQTEATKNLAKEEKEFTQTIVCTKNETYVLGDTTDRKRRCTRVPKKYEEFLKPREVAKDGEETKAGKEDTSIPHADNIRKTYGVDITECSVRIEKVDMYHIIPFCWKHEEYQCQCLKDFLIARSEEKANILASQQDNVDDEDNPTTQGDPGQHLSKYGLRKKLKKRRKGPLYPTKRHYLKLKAAANAIEADASTNSDKTEAVAMDSTNPGPDVQENQPTKSSSRRKQVLNTMVDISERRNVQVRLRADPALTPRAIAPKLLPGINRPAESTLTQNPDKDALRFLLPTANVRQQFLKMLGKMEDAQDEFRLLSFLVLSNRFHRLLFHVWFSRAATTSRYILTMENNRPTPDSMNVRYFPEEMRSDNYLIQWLMEGSIPVTEVQDFLVILRVINSKSFDICGMCEKSKVDYTDEPTSSLPLTPPKATVVPMLAPISVSTVPTMTYNINGTTRQPRKILNIQSQKIPPISCVYPSAALTGQSGLIHASLPSINAKFRWLMMAFSSFAVLNMTTTNYCVPHEHLVELVEQARRTTCTMMFKNREIRGQAAHPDFAIYVTPQHNRYIFIGPYHLHEELTCETLCYYKNMLVSTENYHKIHGNVISPVGSWVKQVQMKIHAPVVTSVTSTPTTNTVKAVLPKAATTLPPKLVRISDFVAAQIGTSRAVPIKLNPISTPNTSLLIVNNSVVAATPSVATTPIALPKPTPKPVLVGPNSIRIKSPISIISESHIPNTNIASDDISLPGLDYRDAEFKDKKFKTLQYLVTNIPGFGYIRIYRCHKTNIIYLMWRYVKMYKTLGEAKKALVTLIESTVIIVPSNFKVTITLLIAKPPNVKLIDGDYYFDTYIAGRFGVHLLSKLNPSKMTGLLRLNEADVQYINERSSEMLLKKCYNIASTFLTKEDLAKIRNWKDMMAALKGTVDSEIQTDTTLTEELKQQRRKHLMLRKKLRSLTLEEDDSILDITPVKTTSEVIEISDEEGVEESVEEELMPKLLPEITLEGQPAITPTISPLNIRGVDEINQAPIIGKMINTPPPQRFVSMAQNFSGAFKLMPHNQNSVLITRIKNPPAPPKTNTNNL